MTVLAWAVGAVETVTIKQRSTGCEWSTDTCYRAATGGLLEQLYGPAVRSHVRRARSLRFDQSHP
jgi:hypothetical protein